MISVEAASAAGTSGMPSRAPRVVGLVIVASSLRRLYSGTAGVGRRTRGDGRRSSGTVYSIPLHLGCTRVGGSGRTADRARRALGGVVGKQVVPGLVQAPQRLVERHRREPPLP